jgi:hypothetical protein
LGPGFRRLQKEDPDITLLSSRRLAAAEEPAEARMNFTAQIATV